MVPFPVKVRVKLPANPPVPPPKDLLPAVVVRLLELVLLVVLELVLPFPMVVVADEVVVGALKGIVTLNGSGVLGSISPT